MVLLKTVISRKFGTSIQAQLDTCALSSIKLFFPTREGFDTCSLSPLFHLLELHSSLDSWVSVYLLSPSYQTTVGLYVFRDISLIWLIPLFIFFGILLFQHSVYCFTICFSVAQFLCLCLINLVTVVLGTWRAEIIEFYSLLGRPFNLWLLFSLFLRLWFLCGGVKHLLSCSLIWFSFRLNNSLGPFSLRCNDNVIKIFKIS